jgi:hypothetical protein
MRSRKNERGSAILIELLIATCITMTFMAASTVSVVKLRAAKNQTDAAIRLRDVSQAQATLAICQNTPTCTPSVSLQNLIPADGSIITTGGYTFSYSYNSGYWFLSADPLSSMSGTQHFYIDYSGVLRASDTGTANAASPIWWWKNGN